ncbi:MAG: thioredoxin family protein, partial [Chloroflexi bacterium]|nr:thioredoxin family protein [Chloroflexota bacterium]
LRKAADMVAAMDVDGDHIVTRAEYTGAEIMWDPFDVDDDGRITGAELLAARRVAQFSGFAAPRTLDERIAVARKYRAEVPGAIPVLVDDLEDSTSEAYGGAPNSAFVIGPDRRVVEAMEWASAPAIESALAALTGRPGPTDAGPVPDLSAFADAFARAKARHANVLLEFTAAGCGACQAMREGPLADAEVQAALGGFEVVELAVENDEAWALFEAFDLSATPAFVALAPDRSVRAKLQGLAHRPAFLGFLARTPPS